MHTALYRMQRTFLGLLLGSAGLYAGVLLMYSIGISPVLDALPAAGMLRTWQLHDYYLHLRIPVLFAMIGVFYLLTLLVFLIAWRTETFALIALALLFSLADVAVNVRLEHPVNHSLRLADVGAHSLDSVYSMERQLFHAIHLRQLCSISAFGLLCIASMLPHSSPAVREPALVA